MTSRKTKATHSLSRGGGSKKRPKGNIDLSGIHDNDDYVVSSDEDTVDAHTPSFRDESDVESEDENLDDKKVRLAREYLASIGEKGTNDDDSNANSSDDEDDESDDDDENDDAAISRKLQRKRLEQEGMLERNHADRVRDLISKLSLTHEATIPADPSSTKAEADPSLSHITADIVKPFRGGNHDLSPTCVALAGINDDRAVSGSKDHSVMLWDIETQSRLTTLSDRWQNTKVKVKQQNASQKTSRNRTSGQVLSIACSDDGKFVAVGRRDTTVSIYDIRVSTFENDCCVQTFTGHKDAVTALTFRSQTHQLFTASSDRCIRHYNLDEMLYLETLYGHQFGVTGIDCHRAERPISVGADRTARAWKLAEDTHLIFRGGAKVPAADAISVVKDNSFITGHQDGSVSLWSIDKKRAISTVQYAHGVVETSSLGRGIVSINCVKGSDLFATGSNDGFLRFWKISSSGSSGASTGNTSIGKKETRGSAIEAIGAIPVHGFVNGIAMSSKAKFCIAAIGQEHRCGRWERVVGAKNRIVIVPLTAAAEKPSLSKTEDFETLDAV